MLNKFRSPSLALKLLALVALPLMLLTGLAACGDSGPSITVYSGRSEGFIGEFLQRWEDTSGVRVNVKYGNSTDLALLINEEQSKSPADVFISQSPGAVGYLDSQGLLAQLPASLNARILGEYRSENGTWIGITGRQRVLIYNPNLVSEEILPNSIDDLTRPEFKGKVAMAPQNSSFQDFVTALRFERGDAETLRWLEAMADNNSPNYPGNSAIVSAVVAGEVEMGLVNHYYLLRELAENPGADGRNHYFDPEDSGSLLILTAGTVLKSSNKQDKASELLDFLTSAEIQRDLVASTREYPLHPGVSAPSGVPNLEAFSSPALNDFGRLGEELVNTINMISQSGLISG